MATIAISALPAATAAASADVMPIVQSGTTKQLSNQLLFTAPRFPGSTSGFTTVQATAIAGTTTLTLPAATDTLVGKATTDTLTNKTLTSPVMTAPALGTVASGIISACTSTSMVMVTPVIGAATGTSLSTTGNQVISGTGKQGYATGSGGAVTQLATKATGVTLNTTNGQITMDGTILGAATIVSFVLTDSTIEAGDVMVINHISGGTLGAYTFNASTAAGSATINVRNATAGGLTEAPVLRFAVIKVVSA